jgi:DNA-binding CsgD family transcriptional regulator
LGSATRLRAPWAYIVAGAGSLWPGERCGRGGARPRRVALAGVDALTASERRVAELAAQGLTNRVIAQSLFITARTVEGHLTNVFRKLDLESREGLAEAMAG